MFQKTELVADEKDSLRRRLVATETAFQELSKQYEQRLEEYVRNINVCNISDCSIYDCRLQEITHR